MVGYIVLVQENIMESFKQNVLNLKKVVEKLEQRVSILEGTKSFSECHFVTTQGEYGEQSLDLDTFRFSKGEYSELKNGYKYSYGLLNPTAELKKECTMLLCGRLDYHGFYILTNNNEIIDYNYEDGVIYTGQLQPIPLTKRLKEILDEKFFETVEKFGGDSPYASSSFGKRIIEISFKHTYKIRPHISFYITPFDKDIIPFISDNIANKKIISADIIEVTQKNCKIRIVFGIDTTIMPNDLVLHYSIQGIIDEPTEILIDV